MGPLLPSSSLALLEKAGHLLRVNILGLFLTLSLFFLSSSATADTLEKSNLPFFPYPEKLVAQEGIFTIDTQSAVITSPALKAQGEILAGILSHSSGFWHRVLTRKVAVPQPLHLKLDPKLPKESYQIEVRQKEVLISGHDEAALSQAVHTFAQTLPPRVPSQAAKIPCLTLTSGGMEVPHRALRLDLAGHLFPLDTLKLLISELAMLKMNTLILGFNSEAGWRLEIKGLPTLTTIGASRPATSEDGTLSSKNYSGHYRAEKITELLAHAKAHQVRVIPSFNFPGGAGPILSSLPDLKAIDSPEAATAIQTILGEVKTIFPDTPVHFQTSEGYFKSHLEPALAALKLESLNIQKWKRVDFAPLQHPPGLTKGMTGAPGLLTIGDVYRTTTDPGTSGIYADLETRFVPDAKALTYTLFPRLHAFADSLTSGEKDLDHFFERWARASTRYSLRKIEVAPSYRRPSRKTLYQSKLETNFQHASSHWPELAFDGRKETFFKSSGELGKNSYLSLQFTASLTGTIEVATGGDDGGEIVDGVLEVSPDGKAWDAIAEFFDGLVATNIPEGTRHLRLRLTAPQSEAIILHEIVFSEVPMTTSFQETRLVEMSKTIHLPITFSCDFTTHPDLAEKIHLFRKDFFQFYKSLVNQLGVPLREKTPISIDLKLDPTSNSPLLNPDQLMSLDSETARSLFFEHLLEHLAAYPDNVPSWFSSGIFIYLKNDLLKKSHREASKKQPLRGGAESAAFFHWFVEKVNARGLAYLSLGCRDGLYQDSHWEACGQKPLSELVRDYRE